MSDALEDEIDALRERVRKLEQTIAKPPPVIVPVEPWAGFAETLITGWNTPVTVLASVVAVDDPPPRWLVKYDDGSEFFSEIVDAVYLKELPESERPEPDEDDGNRLYGRLKLPSFRR